MLSHNHKKLRLDEILVAHNLAPSRAKAQSLIKEKKVIVAGEVTTKPSKLISPESPITITQTHPFVSRGGEKLSACIEFFNINISEKIALDVGASTGGFTDCLLQKGAKSVTCVDVGHSQLDKLLLDNPKVTNIEKTNAKNIDFTALPFPLYDIIVMDVSFISIKKVIEHLWQGLLPTGYFILLVKPQFETTKEQMDRCKGVIKDQKILEAILTDVKNFITSHIKDCTIIGSIESPIKGSDGNQEFLLALTKS